MVGIGAICTSISKGMFSTTEYCGLETCCLRFGCMTGFTVAGVGFICAAILGFADEVCCVTGVTVAVGGGGCCCDVAVLPNIELNQAPISLFSVIYTAIYKQAKISKRYTPAIIIGAR